jgi:hypothetical protein
VRESDMKCRIVGRKTLRRRALRQLTLSAGVLSRRNAKRIIANAMNGRTNEKRGP